MSEFALWDIDHWSLDGLAALDWQAGPGPILLLLVALLLHLVAGGFAPRRVRGSLVLVERGGRFIESHLNRESRGEAARVIRGLLSVVVIAGFASTAGWAVVRHAQPVAYGWIVEVAILASLFGVWHGVRLAGALARALQRARSGDARRLLAERDHTARDYADDHALERGGVEECARSLLYGLVGPVFRYFLLGLPGVLAYRTIEVLDGVVGRRDPSRENFGLTAARLDEVASWLPARLTGLLILLAGVFVPGGSPPRIWRAIRAARSGGAASMAAWVIAAASGALGLSLGGPTRRSGISVTAPWVGDGRARVTPVDLRRAVWLGAVTTVLVAAGLALLAATRHLL